MTQPALSLIDQWNYRITEVPELQKYNQFGNALSYPLPAYENGRLEVCFFYHQGRSLGSQEMRIGPAFAYVVLDAETFTVIRDIDEGAFSHITPFPSYIYSLSVLDREINELRTSHLKSLYDRVIPFYPRHPAGKAGQQVYELLESVTPPLLFPYYEALSPDFMQWLATE